VNSWSGGFQGEVTVTAGAAAVSGWTVRWTASSGSGISQVWNGTLTTSGSSVSVSNAAYNGSVPARGTTTFGFLGTGPASAPALTCTSP
jgi:arabinoxylan arabinofuranohydrolase